MAIEKNQAAAVPKLDDPEPDVVNSNSVITKVEEGKSTTSTKRTLTAPHNGKPTIVKISNKTADKLLNQAKSIEKKAKKQQYKLILP